jgi:competence protein ComEC
VSEKFREISGSWFGNAVDTEAGKAQRGRMDLRLVPAALLTWAAAICGAHLHLSGLLAQLGIMSALAVLFFWIAHWPGRRSARLSLAPSDRLKSGASLGATLGLACILAGGVSGHWAILAVQHEGSPMVDFAAQRSTIVADVVVTAPPRPVAQQGGWADQARWAVPVRVLHYWTAGLAVQEDAVLTVMGSGSWGEAVPGQHLRATGRLKNPGAGQQGRAILAASSEALGAEEPPDVEAIPIRLREAFREAAAGLPRDAAGLLPGMVTGDTAALDEDLEAAMQIVGISHLTAVSGANCSLVLGSLLILARSLRLPRLPAASVALAGLGGFVLVVGPEPSVLRAGLMGVIGVIALASGRRGRSLGFLCLAVIGLLLVDPRLGVSYGFLLSVLATLGIILLGTRLTAWLGLVLPLPLAVAIAVPLSAQLFCSPAIVGLQPNFSTYALLANIASSPFVAPVTLLGTALLPVIPLWPGAAQFLLAPGLSAGCVAAIARFFASSPGSRLPWPEGPPGMASMALMSALTLSVVWALMHPRPVALRFLRFHAYSVRFLAALEQQAGRLHGSLRATQRGRLEPYALNARRIISGTCPQRPLQRPGGQCSQLAGRCAGCRGPCHGAGGLSRHQVNGPDPPGGQGSPPRCRSH